MWSLYGGFLAAFYLALSVKAAVSLPTHPRPGLGALAHFVLIPLLIVTLSGGFLAEIGGEERGALAQGFRRGLITRRYAFAVGFLVGALALAAILVTWHTAAALTTSQTCFVLTLCCICGILWLSPVMGLWWLLRRCGPGAPG